MIEVERIGTLNDTWRDFLTGQSSESFLCSTEFAELWRTMDGKPVYWTITDDDSPAAVLPAVEFGSGRLARLQAMPEGCYGRFLIRDDLTDRRDEYWSSLARALVKKHYVKVFLFDYYDTIPVDGPFEVQPLSTITFDISSDWRPPGSTERRVIRKAGEDGLKASPFDYDKHFDSFMALVKDTEKRRGRKPRYTKKFFKALAELAGTDERVVWTVCEANGKLIASYICLLEQDMLFYWQAYTNSLANQYHANDFLMGKIAEQSIPKGIQQVNLGSTPDEIEGVKQWKLKWGGREQEYSVYTLHSTLGKIF